MTDFTLNRMSDDHWATPASLYEALNAEFDFNDDPCPLHGDELTDGLKREWGSRTFMNPPYSNIAPWIHKAYLESRKGKLIVGLLRGDTSTKWFHNWVLGKAEIRFVKGRVKFGDRNRPAPFASIIAIWTCPDCNDTGFVEIDVRCGRSRKQFCTCPCGQELAEKDEKARAGEGD